MNDETMSLEAGRIVRPGRDDLALLAAFRATLHRNKIDTLVWRRDGFLTVEACVSAMALQWPQVTPPTRATIKSEILRALRKQFDEEEKLQWTRILSMPVVELGSTEGLQP